MQNPFNPQDWLNANTPQPRYADIANFATMTQPASDAAPVARPQQDEHTSEDFLALLDAIEAAAVDLTANYTDWFRIGTAIASTFGEQGREYFHRISKFHNSYTIMECDKKYDDCLRDTNPSVSLASIFYLAKQHGITLPRTHLCQGGMRGTDGIEPSSATIPESIDLQAGTPGCNLSTLSPFLQAVIALESDPTMQQLLLFGALISLSAVMPHVSGIYGGKRVYANLYGFVVAPPASSKGKLADVIQLIKPIDDEIRLIGQQAQEQYQLELAKYRAERNTDAIPPKQPPVRKLLLPANASSTAIYQALNDNNGRGLTFETEGDTASQTLKSDYGNYSDGLRKAFHHEPISYMRRKDAEEAYIAHPRWSVLLSGTPAQVTTFIPNSENGLFSRFLFFCLPRTYEWKNVFESDTPMDDYFLTLGQRYLVLYHTLKQRTAPLTFRFSKEQQRLFNDHFAAIQTEYAALYGDDLIASIRRLGLICFRLAMVLSVTRYIDCPERLEATADTPTSFTCLDEDFQTALSLIETYMQHTAYVYTNLLTPIDSAVIISSLSDQQQRFYAVLPNEFTCAEATPIAASLRIPKRTADRWLGQLVSKHHLLKRLRPGYYQKTPPNT